MIDDEFEVVPLSDWQQLVETLRTLDAEVTETDDELSLQRGSATFTVGRDGSVTGAMPLHEFERGGVERLAVDAAGERIRVTTSDGARYEFRLP